MSKPDNQTNFYILESLSWVYLLINTVIAFWTQLSHMQKYLHYFSSILSKSILLFISGFQGQKCLLSKKLNLDLCHLSFQNLFECSSCVGWFFFFHSSSVENAIRHSLWRLWNQIALFSHMCQSSSTILPQNRHGSPVFTVTQLAVAIKC